MKFGRSTGSFYVSRKLAGPAFGQGDSVLGDATFTRRTVRQDDMLADLAADESGRVLFDLQTIGLTKRIPWLLFKVGLSGKAEFVGSQPFEAGVVQLLRPHAWDQVAKVFNELAVLHRIDATRALGFVGDFQG